MIALPHLAFLSVLAVGAWAVGVVESRRWDFGTKIGAVTVLGVASGMLLGVWGM
ncbi:MAG: hypothetical protein R2686_07010 [Candidatus Nanopelagicales bacterium]